MVFNALASLAVVMIVAGLVLLAVSVALTRRARRNGRYLKALMQLGAQNLEPLSVAGAAWPILQAAGWAYLCLDGDWFGHSVRLEHGQRSPAMDRGTPLGSLSFQIDSENDVRLKLELMHSQGAGDNWLFAEQLARVVALLLETSLRIRTQALSAALAERANLSLYLQHDMRNLAQWVIWACNDFVGCGDDPALLVMARRLQKNAPLAIERAQRLIAALGQQPANDQAQCVDLAQALSTAAHLAGLDVDVVGQAQGWIAQGLLLRALDNLFTNLAANWRAQPVTRPVIQVQSLPASAAAPAMAQIKFVSPWQPDVALLEPEKLFEPFASGRPGGLGLGLYQARKSLLQAGGRLNAVPGAQGLEFSLLVPLCQP